MKTPDEQIPYSDPLRDVIEALEDSVDQLYGLPPSPFFHGEDMRDGIGRALDAVEASIEGTVVRPAEPIPVEPLPLAPEPPGLVSQGASEGPPLEPEPGRLEWIALNPAPESRPFFTHEDLDAPSDRPRSRGSTGIRNNEGSRERWCPQDRCTVDEEEDCPSCKEFGDHDGDGVEQCRYDWLEENQEQDGANEGDEE